VAGAQIDQASLHRAVLHDCRDLPLAVAQDAPQPPQQVQVKAGDGQAALLADGRLQAAPVIGLVVQAGRSQGQGQAADGLVAGGVVAGRHVDLAGGAVGGQAAFDGLLRRDGDGHIPLHDRLAGQRPAGGHVFRTQAQAAATAHSPGGDAHGAAPAAALPAAGLHQAQPGQTRCLGEQRAGRDAHRLRRGVEGDEMGHERRCPCCIFVHLPGLLRGQGAQSVLSSGCRSRAS